MPCAKQLVFAAIVLVTAAKVSAVNATTCESLSSLSLPEVVSITAKPFPGGTFQPPNPAGFPPQPFLNPPLSGLPPFCEVSLVVSPQIRIEIWLPSPVTWNHRFNAIGNGGYSGDQFWSGLPPSIEAGFAVASTDNGHPGNIVDGSFALNTATDTLNWGLIRDFAQRSEHELASKGKPIIEAYYGRPPAFSYWTGCSTGGRQGWMEAQLYPEDYDGILAGAPAMNWDRFIPAELWPQVVMNEEVGGPIPAAKLDRVTNAAVAACAGKDGGLASDGFLNDPRACRFNLAAHAQALGLTPAQVSSINKMWDGPRGDDGQRLWFGLQKDANLSGSTTGFALAGSIPFPIATMHFAYWLHQNPGFDWHTVTESSFVADFFKSERLFDGVIGTDRTDLDRMIRHRTRLIGYHGWEDQLIFPRGSTNYFERLFDRYGKAEVDTFARLFMVPGMQHCQGGPGPNSFGNNPPGSSPVPADAQHDVFIALQRWVEHGVAPEQVVATKYVDDNPKNGIAFTRPLCVFPKIARYSGKDDARDAANWECVLEPTNRTIQEADEVLPELGIRDRQDAKEGND